MPTWAHTDLDTAITLLSDVVAKLRNLRSSPNLPTAERDALEDAIDDARVALIFARKMRERQEDIVEGTSDEPANNTAPAVRSG